MARPRTCSSPLSVPKHDEGSARTLLERLAQRAQRVAEPLGGEMLVADADAPHRPFIPTAETSGAPRSSEERERTGRTHSLASACVSAAASRARTCASIDSVSTAFRIVLLAATCGPAVSVLARHGGRRWKR